MKKSFYTVSLLLLSQTYLPLCHGSPSSGNLNRNLPFLSNPLHSFFQNQSTNFGKFDLQQDTVTIQGVVKDSLGAPIQGTIVSLKNTSLNVVSDQDGKYTILAEPTGILLFNKTGFAKVQESINNRHEINVLMRPPVLVEDTTATLTDSLASAKDSIQTGVISNPIAADTSIQEPAVVSTVKQNMLKGSVHDSKGPVLGVTVSVKGGSNSSSTDNEGNFSILADSSATLQFSAIGYQEQAIKVGTNTTIAVILKSQSRTIEAVQVVAVGYGTMNRATLASAVSSIGAAEIENEVLPSIAQAIQGKAGGVQVSQKSGSPGGGLSIRVRGTTSINASSDPLYVVDGIPINSTTNFVGGSNFNFGGATQGINILASINPGDVQSVEILKDAASSSIYGARAANGVVLITTKKGQAGTSQFHFNMYEGFSQMPSERKYKMMNTAKYQDYMLDYYKYADREIPKEILANPDVNTDWQDAIFRNAPTRNYELAAQGGSENTQYYTSIGYMQQGGILRNSDFNRLSARLNLDHQHSEKLRFNTAINLTRAKNARVQEENSKEGPTKSGFFMAPNLPVYTADGSYNYDQVSRSKENPVAMLELPTNQAETFRVLANVSAEYQFIPELTLKTSFGTDISFIDETFFMPPNGLRSFASQGGIGARRNTRDQLWINETTLTYDKTFGDHHLNVLAGGSVQESKLEFVHAQRSNFPSNDIGYINAGGVISGADSYPEEWAIASAFGRINYDYKSKYIVTANMRTDGSSRFGAANRWASFPSVAAAWRLSEEDFLKSSTIVSELKLRGSWGVTGNQNIGNYASYTLYSAGQNYLGQTGFIPNILGDKNLKWETTKQVDIGIDVGLFHDRINILADYYHKNTSDLLMAAPIWHESGYQNRFTNAGNIENKGFEFELTTRNLVGAFQWTTSLNMTFNRNKVLALPEGNRILGGVDNLNMAEVGQPLGVFYGWKMIGVNPQTGIIDFEGADGNPTRPTQLKDRQIIGDPNPKFFGGITNTFQYKNIDLSIMGQFTYGNDIFNYNLASGLEGYSPSSNAFIDWENRWRNPGDITDVPRPTPGNLEHGAVSDRFIQDGSFFRIRNITLGYTFNDPIMKKLHISRLRVYATVQNAFVFTNYRGFDPEVSSSHGGNNTGLIYGYDYGSYPQPRIFTAGVNLSF